MVQKLIKQLQKEGAVIKLPPYNCKLNTEVKYTGVNSNTFKNY
jgi:hypothetical protein